MGKLTDLKNIGKKLEEQLLFAGIDTPEELAAVGSKDAWSKILAFDSSACINRLYALQGAIDGIDRFSLSEEKKCELKEFYYTKKGK